jgi:hypothetical protein
MLTTYHLEQALQNASKEQELHHAYMVGMLSEREYYDMVAEAEGVPVRDLRSALFPHIPEVRYLSVFEVELCYKLLLMGRDLNDYATIANVRAEKDLNKNWREIAGHYKKLGMDIDETTTKAEFYKKLGKEL